MIRSLSLPRAVVLLTLASAGTRPGAVLAADNFASATVLTGAVATATEGNLSATVEPGEPDAGYRTLWWTWTAPGSGRASVVTTGSTGSFTKKLTAWLPKSENAAINGLALIATDNSDVSFPVIEGTRYYISGGSYFSNESGTYKVTVLLDSDTDINQLNLQGRALFSNDLFSRRAPLTGPSASGVSYSPSAGTESGGQEPDSGYRTMWWTWTAPDSGVATFSGQGSSNFTRELSVFEGTSLPALLRIANTTSTSLALPVTAGAVYQICLGSYFSNESGSLVMSVNLNTTTAIHSLPFGAVATATNDAFEKRTVLTGTYVSAIGYGNYATREAFEPDAGYASLWWSWTAPAPGLVRLSTKGSDTDSTKFLTVWTGGAVDSLTRVAKSETSREPSVSFTAEAGRTYHFSNGAYFSNESSDSTVLTVNAPGKVSPGLGIAPAVRLHWLSTAGTTYRIESSADLKTWTPTGDVFLGDGSVKESFHATRPGAGYFRVTE